MLYFLCSLSKALATPRKKSNTHTKVVTPRLKTIGQEDLDCLSDCFDIEEES